MRSFLHHLEAEMFFMIEFPLPTYWLMSGIIMCLVEMSKHTLFSLWMKVYSRRIIMKLNFCLSKRNRTVLPFFADNFGFWRCMLFLVFAGLTQRDNIGCDVTHPWDSRPFTGFTVSMSPLAWLQFSRSVASDSLWPHESQHARPPCLSPTTGVYLYSCPLSRWCHPAISSLCRPLLLLPPIPPSIRVFSNESTLRMRWPKYWSFSFSISPSNEHPGLISFRMDWFDLLAIQGTLKSLVQHHSSKASIFWRSAFFTVQLSHPHMTTGKTIALTRWIFVGKVTSLLFNMLSRLVITFLPGSKRLLISRL